MRLNPVTKTKQSVLRPLLIAVVLCAGAFSTRAQTPVVLAPVPQLQFFTQSGLPLAFGCVFTYQSQTTNQLATFTDFTGTFSNPNPVILSAGGSANIWIKAGQAYSFVVKSSGGTNCSLGTTQFTIDGIGGGLTTLTTAVTPSGGTATFTDQSQNQLFTLLLTGNVVGQPITAVGIIPPGLITFQITQDGAGAHTFSWPANTLGAATICASANCVTSQTFLWNGTNATAVGPATYSSGPGSMALSNLFDYGLTASLPICSDANKQLSSTCAGLIPNADLANSSITFNGQTVALGASGNVNVGAAAHSITLNQGNGSAETGLALTADQVPVGVTSADPAAKSLCNGNLNYNTSTHVFSCPTTASVLKAIEFDSCTLAPDGGSAWDCNATASWGVTLPDANYNVQCSLSSPATGPQPSGYGPVIKWTRASKTTTQFGYTITGSSSGDNGQGYKVDCVAIE